jgi:ribosome biogenesis GTPase A
MKKTKELIRDNLKLVDAVLEVVDARIPVSSRNPSINELVLNKTRIIALNKADLADERSTDDWIKLYRKSGTYGISLNSNTGEGVQRLLKLLEEIQEEKNEGRIPIKYLRLMVVGVPNVGKSSLINKLTGKKATKTGDKPGVTRGKQWLSMRNGMQLLDTPGILWPKFSDPATGLNLAFCGSIKDEIMDIASLALELVGLLSVKYPSLLMERYKMDTLGETPLETMEMIANKRGFILSGRRVDYERTGRTIVDEFRSGAIGRITLEQAKDAHDAEGCIE